MRIGIIGSGIVGQTLGSGLINLGNEVKIGSRNPKKLDEWVKNAGINGSASSNSEAASFGQIIIIATQWSGTKNAIDLAGHDNFHGKIVIDVTNPLDFSSGGPKPAVTYPDSAAGMVQKWLPDAKIVKAFNIVPAHVMVNPKINGTSADLFIAGDAEAKKFASGIAKKWGWDKIIDMGGLESAYLIEMLAMLSIQYGIKYNDWNFAYKFLQK